MPHSSGSGLNAPGGCLSKPTTSAVSALPAASIACAVISAEPPVAQPFLTLMNGHAGEPEHRHRRVGVAGGVRAAGGEVDLLPAEAGVGERGAGGVRGHLQAGDARVAAEGVDAEADDGDVVAHAGSTGRNAKVTARVPGAGSASAPSPCRSRSCAGSDSVRRASTRTSPGSST